MSGPSTTRAGQKPPGGEWLLIHPAVLERRSGVLRLSSHQSWSGSIPKNEQSALLNGDAIDFCLGTFHSDSGLIRSSVSNELQLLR